MSKKFNKKAFRRAVKEKRVLTDDKTIEDCSKQIGISKPTLSRIENESTPNMTVFVKILNWLGHNADKYIK